MANDPSSAVLSSPAAVRNRDPILEVLRRVLPASGLVLHIAEGSGEHVVHFARALPDLSFQPTDPDADARASIAARRAEAGLGNLSAPLPLDATDPDSWPVTRADAIVAINMIHISPWAATEGLLAGAERVLEPGGVLFLYGPYVEAGVETAESNLAFDRSLRGRDPAWGLRDLDEVSALAARHGLRLTERVEMPANNLSVVFVRE
jgi:SAM-dependent methyltransferase